ncbi:MAG: hypothetical protein ACKVKF_07650 [Rhodobacterales bacterium]|nr:hypothetical protein [Puniceibacterium antarcticum]
MSGVASEAAGLDLRLLVPLVAALCAFVAWVGRIWYEGWQDNRRRARAQDNLVRALYAEIDFNTRDMEEFLEKSPSEAVLRDKMTADPNLVPHITDARHTEIYRCRISELHTVKHETLRRMVHFYGVLEKIKVQIDADNYPSYKTLSIEGRMNAVLVIIRTAERARDFGQDILDDMAEDYVALGLTRFDRSFRSRL